MIRPILYVNLPAVVYALDRWTRSKGSELARFVCAPDLAEPRPAVSSLLSTLDLINPSSLTWICEDRWRLLGLAQARRRGQSGSWDLRYLAVMPPAADGLATASPDSVLLELLEYALNAAVTRGVDRVFATLDDESPALELFARAGFQRYARELTYLLADPSGLWPDGSPGRAGKRADHWLPANLALRRWHRHDTWGLLRLYDAGTPRRVQVAECLTSDELLQTRAVGGRMWALAPMEAPVHCYVLDRGVRLGGWLRLRHGRGSQPHQLWLMVHPEDADLAGPLLRFGLRHFAAAQPRPVLCNVREYDQAVVEALRAAGFEHAATQALLTRHLFLRAVRQRTVPATESRVAYGMKGLGPAHSRMDRGGKTPYATPDH